MSKEIFGISLFSGAGGMDVGFVNAGVNVILANELNKDACDTYEANHPKTILLKGDLLNFKDTISKYTNIDIVFGGPPCQGFSVAGKMNPNDERSKLIWHFLDVVKRTNPKVFVMENVKALGCLSKWQEIRNLYIKNAQELGYHCHYIVLNASDFGVSQKRERVFFIGSKKKIDFNKLIDVLEKFKTTPEPLRKLFQQLPPYGTEGNPITCTAKITLAETPVMRKSPYAGMMFNGMGRPLNLDSISSTLPASMGGNKTPIIDEKLLKDFNADDWVKNYHHKLLNKKISSEYKLAPNHLRRLTIKEAMLIQSFPLNYNFKGSKSSIYTQIGNAVPCKLAECVAKAIIITCL